MPATAALWLPQMLNLDLIGGVSFSKGCYVGQEIVARAQHLGRLKRRTLRYVGPPDAVLQPAQALFSGETLAAQVVDPRARRHLHAMPRRRRTALLQRPARREARRLRIRPRRSPLRDPRTGADDDD